MARLFIAAHLPDDVLDLVEALARPDEAGVRYTTRGQWHVTLRFFGDADIAEATAALSTIEHEPVDVVLGPAVSKLGRFVVVIPVAGLDDLAAVVDAATGHVGEPPDPRPFNGHVTVARLKRRGACRIAGEPISARWTVGAIDLVRSFTEPDGARYEVVATRPLG